VRILGKRYDSEAEGNRLFAAFYRRLRGGGQAVIVVMDLRSGRFAELTRQQDGVIRQQVIEHLMRQIMQYDAEFRREEATSAAGSSAKR
jgi:hypothetical protein